jgi:hypothetical protein
MEELPLTILCFVFSCAQGFVCHFVFRVCCRIPVPLIFRSQEAALGMLYLFSSPVAARLRYLGIFSRSSFTCFGLSYYQRSPWCLRCLVHASCFSVAKSSLRGGSAQFSSPASVQFLIQTGPRQWSACGRFSFLHSYFHLLCHPLSRSYSRANGSKSLSFLSSNHSYAVVFWTHPRSVRWNAC